MRFGRDRRQIIGLATRVGVTAIVVIGATTLRSSAAESADHPGLPDSPGTFIAPQATGLAYDNAAKQWLRTPDLQLAGWSTPSVEKKDVSCRRLKPYTTVETYTPEVFLYSPPGAPAKYGYQGPFTVRTVAFGAIPVEAQIELKQPRDADNLPTPIDVTQTTSTYCSGLGPHGVAAPDTETTYHTSGSGALDVEVTKLTVDGVDVGLGKSCATARPGKLAITARDFEKITYADGSPDTIDFGPGEDPQEAANNGTTPYFQISYGGRLHGSVDIPSFSGCKTTSGDDLSKLVTAAVSGDDNPIEMRSGGLGGNAYNTGTGGSEIPKCVETHSCTPYSDLPIPTSAPAP